MRLITSLLCITLVTISCRLTNFPSFHVDKNEIVSASIHSFPDTSIYYLTEAQTQELLLKLNQSEKIGPAKYIKLYRLDLQLANDSILSLHCGTSDFAINTMRTYKVKSENYFQQLLEEVKNNSDNR